MTFKLGPREGLEYKYRMEKGGSLVYSWKSTGVVKFDFHGEPVGAPKGYAEWIVLRAHHGHSRLVLGEPRQ